MAKVTDSEDRVAQLILLDGSSASATSVPCPMCGRPMLRVFLSMGVRRRKPSLDARTDVCITKNWKFGVPCPRAALALSLIEDLMEASRAP